MTREEAIICKVYLENLDKYHTCNEYKLLMQLIEQEPCEDCCNGNQIEKAKLCQKSYLAGMEHKQEPCEDAISRQAVNRLVWRFLKKATDENIAFYEHFLELPSVTPQPKTGDWIKQNDDYCDWYECSECGYGSGGEMQYSSEYDVRTNYCYCPNCGAKMVDPHESEEKDGA